MATDEGGLAPEPGKEPAANGTPSPGKRNVNKARRLLPMELRKRRRAAKLQVSAQKKARVSLDPPQTPVKPARYSYKLCLEVADLPLDVVPKAKLSILTAYPYPFQRTNSQIKKQALQSFIAANGNSAEESGYQTTAVRWQQALHYFVHPADSVPTSILLNRATAATTNEPLLGEAAEKNQEGTKRTKKRRLCAVMSQSNSRIRKGLHHLNVEYTMPYINTNQTQREVGAFHLLEEELEATRSGNKDKRSENMHGTDSLLLFHGHDAVHGLYEFLINRAPMSNQDVPELYTLHPFTNASIQSLQVTSFGRVGGSAADPPSEDQPSRAATLFRTEILGFCFPSSVAKLQGVLKDEWEATKASYGSAAEVSQTGKHDAQIALRTYMEAVAGAERLNAVKLGAQTTGPGEKRGDLRKRQQELEFSKRRVEAVMVTKMESRYDVETTTRTIVARR
uniref:Uncharacterized protein n=1 Tax=Phytophthora ramorum TaxID=164328 RepID=H3HCJ7_PHYRM